MQYSNGDGEDSPLGAERDFYDPRSQLGYRFIAKLLCNNTSHAIFKEEELADFLLLQSQGVRSSLAAFFSGQRPREAVVLVFHLTPLLASPKANLSQDKVSN
jgi:hypothetical protein